MWDFFLFLRLPFWVSLLSWRVMKFEQIPLSMLELPECENPFLPLSIFFSFFEKMINMPIVDK